jgi:serine/threonine protein kinase
MDSTPKDLKGASSPDATVPGSELAADDATRILSASQKKEVIEQDGATVIVSGAVKQAAIAVHSQVTVFPVTQPKPFATDPALTPSSNQSAASTDSSLLAIGTRVAEFEISRLIGQGGFGVVYEAWDHALERVVAIKEYMPTSLANRQSDGSVVPLSERHKETFDIGMRSFINEARLLAQFDHPSLLKVYRFWQERGTTYMVMPCYQGDTLKQALAKTKDQVNQAWLLNIIDGVTQALAVMHRANCYHRDIAPDNIMLLESSGLPVVLDFGAARRVITDMTQAITVILKPGYAPIEQYSESPDMAQGAWTDVYALCAVMYVAITGRAPPPSVARMINDRCAALSGNAALLEHYSPQVLAAIDAGLAVRPETRPQSMGDLRLALGLPPCDDDSMPTKASATRAMPPSGTQRAKQSGIPHQRKPMLLATAGLGAVLAIAGLGWWWSQSGGDKPNATKPPSTVAPTAANVASAPAVVAPVTLPVQTLTPSQSLNDLLRGVQAGFEVNAKPSKPEVRIGKDKLEFQILSSKTGFAYVYLLSSGGDMYLLFPNALDKRNRIEAGATLSLPRTAWAMDAGGPAGVDEFVVLVSERERDLKLSGIQYEGVFGQFSTKILSALESARGAGPSPLLGTPICDAPVPCADNYGAISFKITEK